jgi:hypothetical protein
MAKMNLGDLIGGWAFLIGVVLAIIVGLFPALGTTNVLTALVVIGILIGLFNIATKEVTPFLMSGAVLIIAGALGQDNIGITIVDNILKTLLAIFIPAVIIVAIKNVFSLAKR